MDVSKGLLPPLTAEELDALLAVVPPGELARELVKLRMVAGMAPSGLATIPPLPTEDLRSLQNGLGTVVGLEPLMRNSLSTAVAEALLNVR